MIEEMTFPLGICPTHGPKLAINGVPTCIKCQAKENNKDRVLVVNNIQDPGEDYFKGGKANPQAAVVAPSVQAKKVVPSTGHTLESGLQEILSILAVIPMPSSMKQYKLLMSVKQKIESALQEG